MQTLRENLSSLLILLIFLGLVFSTPKVLLFYDAPEYMKIVRDNTFLEAIAMGHLPIHPVFIALLWIGSRFTIQITNISSWEYAVNITAMLFGTISILFFYKISEFFFKQNTKRLLSLLIFSFFPLVWIINSNLMVETLMLPIFISSIYLSLNMQRSDDNRVDILYIISIFLLLGSHIQTLFWLPAILGFYILSSQDEAVLKNTRDLVIKTFIGVLLGIGLYSMIYLLSGESVLKSLNNLLFAHHGTLDYQDPTGFLRMARNMFLTVSRGFGVLSAILLAFFIYQDKSEKSKLLGWGLLLISIVVEGAIWSGDYMQRRQVYLGVILAILIVKRLKLKSLAVVIYLVIILIPNILLYSDSTKNMPIAQIKHLSMLLPENEVYLQTHYLSPFVESYDGQIVWVDSIDVNKVNSLLEKNRVFIDSQGIKAPYYLYSGNNLHITSLGKVGTSASKVLFTEFNFCYYTNYGEIAVYEIIEKDTDCSISYEFAKGREPGESAVFYSSNSLKRLHRRRVDYGDIFTWSWYLITDKKDALDWVYADANGDVIFVDTKSIVEDPTNEALVDMGEFE